MNNVERNNTPVPPEQLLHNLLAQQKKDEKLFHIPDIDFTVPGALFHWYGKTDKVHEYKKYLQEVQLHTSLSDKLSEIIGRFLAMSVFQDLGMMYLRKEVLTEGILLSKRKTFELFRQLYLPNPEISVEKKSLGQDMLVNAYRRERITIPDSIYVDEAMRNSISFVTFVPGKNFQQQEKELEDRKKLFPRFFENADSLFVTHASFTPLDDNRCIPLPFDHFQFGNFLINIWGRTPGRVSSRIELDSAIDNAFHGTAKPSDIVNIIRDTRKYQHVINRFKDGKYDITLSTLEIPAKD